MKISYTWLQDYFTSSLPAPEAIAGMLTMHAFEVESIEKIGNDTVLDIKVLPDRSHDCLSHQGIAREVAVLTGVPLKKEIDGSLEGIPESNTLRIEVENGKLCRRMSALVLENIEVKESPEWLQDRLTAIGQRPINNIVDATNYVMFGIGQPLHAYDRALLNDEGGWKIVVREAKGETLLALDSKEYDLEDGTGVIADGNSGLALGIAGVKGGKASEISHNTKNIILEAANFDPVSVRKTAKKLGLRTDASVRFENEITPELTTKALKQVSDLILNIAGTSETQVEGVSDWYPKKAALYKIGLSLKEIQSVLGIEITQKEVEGLFNRIGYEWKYINPREVIIALAENLLDTPYKFGASVLYDSPRAFDCSSFSAYLYVEAGVAIPRICNDQFLWGESINENEAKPGDMVFFESKREGLAPDAVGHNAIYLGDGKMIHAGGVDKGYAKVVKEVITESKYYATGFMGYRRLLPTEESRFVITIPAERIDLRIKEDLIEEIGRIYGYTNIQAKPIEVPQKEKQDKKEHWVSTIKNFFVEKGFSEVITYAFRNNGKVEILNPLAKDKAYLRENLSESLEEALHVNSRNADLLGVEEIRIFEIGNVFSKEKEYTAIAFGVRGTKKSETANEAKDSLEEILGVTISWSEKNGVYEANLDEMMGRFGNVKDEIVFESRREVRYAPFSVYPFIGRDIAVFVPEGEDEKEIIEVVKREAGELLVQYRLFDTFTKEFPEGKKTSFAYRFVFQSSEKTLTDEEISPIMEKVTSALNAKLGWQVR